MTAVTDPAAEPRHPARRHLALARELLGVSVRRVPGLTLALLLTQTAAIAVVAATALCLRQAVDASAQGRSGTAVAAALGAAVAYSVTAVTTDLGGNIKGLIIDKVSLLDLSASVHRDIASLDGVEHLESGDFLDRTVIVAGSTWSIMNGFWAAVMAAFGAAQLAVALLLLGTVSPWLLALLGFAAAPLWFDQRGQRAVSRAETGTAEAYRLQQHLFDLATQAGPGKEVRVAGAGEQLAARQAAAWDETVRARTRAQVTAALWTAAGWLVFSAGFTVGLAAVIYRVSHGHGSAGDIVLAITVAVTLLQSVQATVGGTTTATAARRVVEPFLWLRDYIAAERERPDGTAPAPTVLGHGIALEGLTFRYPGAPAPALDDVSILLPAGSVVAVVGEYGSGKTTLVKLLTKLYRPSSGTIQIDGHDLAEIDTAGWRAATSAAFQDFGRYRTRLAQTVGLGDVPHIDDRERTAAAIADADASAFVARLPQGQDTQLGRPLGGVDLSEGQWQKTALARASMRPGPLLFVLDEPTASLDAPSEEEIFQRYMARARQLAARAGAVTVVVSHRFSTVAGADLILVLEKGRLVEAGPHADLLARGGRYADLFGLQAAAYAS